MKRIPNRKKSEIFIQEEAETKSINKWVENNEDNPLAEAYKDACIGCKLHEDLRKISKVLYQDLLTEHKQNDIEREIMRLYDLGFLFRDTYGRLILEVIG